MSYDHNCRFWSSQWVNGLTYPQVIEHMEFQTFLFPYQTRLKSTINDCFKKNCHNYIGEKFRKQFYSFTNILPDYVSYEISKKFEK